MTGSIENVSKCQCGAYSVTIDDENYSMTEETFVNKFGHIKAEHEYYNCNHCVNHWGVDLCACGSGEKPEECDGEFPECGTPMQTLGESMQKRGWLAGEF